MNAFKIWIATHPTEPDNQEFSLTEPSDHSTYIYSDQLDNDAYVNWVEHICIPIQEQQAWLL